MAKREQIKINDYEICGFNVSETVGIGANQPGDVMLVKAMFDYLASRDRFWVTGAKSANEIPKWRSRSLDLMKTKDSSGEK